MTAPNLQSRRRGCLFLLAVMAFTALGIVCAFKGLAP